MIGLSWKTNSLRPVDYPKKNVTSEAKEWTLEQNVRFFHDLALLNQIEIVRNKGKNDLESLSRENAWQCHVQVFWLYQWIYCHIHIGISYRLIFDLLL